MRRSLFVLLALGMSASAFAQQRGTIALDAMTTPGRHFGLGFYITDRLSLRPSLGIGYAGSSGTYVNAGADLRYDITRHGDWSLYATTSAFYQNGGRSLYGPSGSQSVLVDPAGLQYGGGLGLRRRITDRLAVMLDGRYVHTPSYDPGTSPFGTFRLNDQNRIVGALGLTFNLR